MSTSASKIPKHPCQEILDLYQVFLQVEGAQQLETVEAGHADDPVGGQVEDLQTLLIAQPFNLLQLVPPLRGRTERATRTKHLTFIKKRSPGHSVMNIKEEPRQLCGVRERFPPRCGELTGLHLSFKPLTGED